MTWVKRGVVVNEALAAVWHVRVNELCIIVIRDDPPDIREAHLWERLD